MYKIKQIGVLSFGKILGISGAAVGLIIGVVYGMIGILLSIVGGVASQDNGGGAGFAALGIGTSLVVMVACPLMFGAIHFIVGLIYGLILNLVLSMAGGLEIQLEAPMGYKQ